MAQGTQTERENKVVFHNRQASAVIINGKIRKIDAGKSDGRAGIEFFGLVEFKTFIDNCKEVYDLIDGELSNVSY